MTLNKSKVLNKYLENSQFGFINTEQQGTF